MAATTLTRTISSTGNIYKGTLSVWLKRLKNGSEESIYVNRENGNNNINIRFMPGNTLNIEAKQGGSTVAEITTTPLFMDPISWYHLVIGIDSTLASSGDRIRVYSNGNEITSFSTETQPSQDQNMSINEAGTQALGSDASSGGYFNGLMTQAIWVDGTQYAASDFGSFSANGVWTPNTAPSVTYGTNGFNIDFTNSSDMGNDVSGNANDLTVSGTCTQTQDSPSNNYSTLNSLGHASANFTLIEGNTYSGGADNNWRSIFGTIGSGTGKYYYEMKCIGTSGNERFGACTIAQANMCTDSAGRYDDSTYGSEGYGYASDGQKTNNGGSTSYGNTWTTNDILSCAIDLDNNFIYFGKNGTWQDSGDPTSGASGTGAAYTIASGIYIPAFTSYGAAANLAFNFGNGYFRTTPISSAGTNASGEGVFEYDVPTGYTAFCTKGFNL
jgi:hypothetical protein